MVAIFGAPLDGKLKMNQIPPTRIVLADDHDLIRQGIRRFLARYSQIEVVGEARDGLEAIQVVELLKPDVLLLDIEMPKLDGIEVARRLRMVSNQVHILILSAYDDKEFVRGLLDLGVSGYLVKGEAPNKILNAIRSVVNNSKLREKNGTNLKTITKPHQKAHRENALNFRQLEVLRLLSLGRSEEEIATLTRQTWHDVTDQVNALIHQLGVSTPEKAVELAFVEGWIE